MYRLKKSCRSVRQNFWFFFSFLRFFATDFLHISSSMCEGEEERVTNREICHFSYTNFAYKFLFINFYRDWMCVCVCAFSMLDGAPVSLFLSPFCPKSFSMCIWMYSHGSSSVADMFTHKHSHTQTLTNIGVRDWSARSTREMKETRTRLHPHKRTMKKNNTIARNVRMCVSARATEPACVCLCVCKCLYEFVYLGNINSILARHVCVGRELFDILGNRKILWTQTSSTGTTKLSTTARHHKKKPTVNGNAFWYLPQPV